MSVRSVLPISLSVIPGIAGQTKVLSVQNESIIFCSFSVNNKPNPFIFLVMAEYRRYRSDVSLAVPIPVNLATAEIAVNYNSADDSIGLFIVDNGGIPRRFVPIDVANFPVDVDYRNDGTWTP